MNVRTFGLRGFVYAACVAAGSMASLAHASTYTVSGSYADVIPNTNAGTFSFGISGTYDSSAAGVFPFKITAATSGEPPLGFVVGDTYNFNTGPLRTTSYIFNDPSDNFQITFPDPFVAGSETGGHGTSYINGYYANLTNVSITATPEPASLSALALCGVAMLGRRPRRQPR